jgi:hypothetical protein
MMPHDREAYRQQMGHVWLGFSEVEIARLLTDAGFETLRLQPLPPDSAAQGPTLFAAAARRGATIARAAAPAGARQPLTTTQRQQGESR